VARDRVALLDLPADREIDRIEALEPAVVLEDGLDAIRRDVVGLEPTVVPRSERRHRRLRRALRLPNGGSASSSARGGRSGSARVLAPVKIVAVTGSGEGHTMGQ
jgi:hypothetical protein